jgi:hypothetical protein
MNVSDGPPQAPRTVTSRRVVGVLVGVVALQVLFALSYIGGFGDPTPTGLRVAVSGPTAEVADQAAAQLTSAAGGAVHPHAGHLCRGRPYPGPGSVARRSSPEDLRKSQPQARAMPTDV